MHEPVNQTVLVYRYEFAIGGIGGILAELNLYRDAQGEFSVFAIKPWGLQRLNKETNPDRECVEKIKNHLIELVGAGYLGEPRHEEDGRVLYPTQEERDGITRIVGSLTLFDALRTYEMYDHSGKKTGIFPLAFYKLTDLTPEEEKQFNNGEVRDKETILAEWELLKEWAKKRNAKDQMEFEKRCLTDPTDPGNPFPECFDPSITFRPVLEKKMQALYGPQVVVRTYSMREHWGWKVTGLVLALLGVWEFNGPIPALFLAGVIGWILWPKVATRYFRRSVQVTT